MNKKLMEARRKFAGQKGKVTAGYDNTPIPEGKYIAEVAQSEVSNRDRDGVSTPVLYMRVVITEGEKKGRSMFPYGPSLVDAEGIAGAAKNIMAILGDVVPGKVLPNGEFEVALDKFLEKVEDLAHECVGQAIEITVKNSKKAPKEGEQRRQNTYINRGLGEDAKSAKDPRTDDAHPDNQIPGEGNPKATAKKKPVVVRKK